MFFECIVGNGGGGGNGIPLIVTCTSSFAGTTITCTDGTTTLTATCSSTSPYEAIFQLPNIGTWTVSGIVSGTTYSETVLVNNFEAELVDNITITVDVYSAANDTVSYTGIDGNTHTITTNSSGKAANVSITYDPASPTITFKSSVAKNPNSLSSDYSRAITLTRNMTEIKIMPDNAVYWYGYQNNLYNYQNVSGQITFNTNYVHLAETGNGNAVLCNQNALSISKAHAICRCTRSYGSPTHYISYWNKKISSLTAPTGEMISQTNTILHANVTVSANYVSVGQYDQSAGDIYALWYETA